MKKLHKALLAGGVTLAVLVPAATAFAAGHGPDNGRGDGTGDRGNGTCTYDQTGDHVPARDGTGRGTPDDVRPMDGTGNQWRAGR